MKEHATLIGSLLALLMVLGTVIFMECHGTNDTSLVVVLATGAIGIASAIAGIKPTPPPPIPGTTAISSVSVPPLIPNETPLTQEKSS